MKIQALFIAATIALSSGCASIVSDSSYPVAITSEPSGASFTITNKTGTIVHNGQTPATVTLKSGAGYFAKASYILTFSKEGFDDQVVNVTSSMDGWYIGNIVFGGLIGLLIVDPATGAMYKLPETTAATLQPNNTSAAHESQLNVMDIAAVPANIQSQLQRIN